MNQVTTSVFGEIEVRARYPECDPMGVVHHTVYPVWFEMGRTELLREHGLSYADVEAMGVFLAVIRMEVRYRRPARYDDRLQLRTTLVTLGHVKIDHAYELRRGDELLVTGTTRLACLDGDGRPQVVPDVLASHLAARA